MLVLAFDTATDVATSALLDDGEVLGERASVAKTLLEDVDALLRRASARPRDIGALVVGTGPGSFTSTRIGLATARGLALALGIEGAGVSTLAALAEGSEGGLLAGADGDGVGIDLNAEIARFSFADFDDGFHGRFGLGRRDG